MKAGFTVEVYIESRYRANRKRVVECVQEELIRNGVVSNVEVSVAIVGSRKMRSLNKKYRKKDYATNVLSFLQQEGDSMPHKSDTIMLGDVVVCYPIAVEEAARDQMLVDDKICMLVQHSVRHLLGIHHD